MPPSTIIFAAVGSTRQQAREQIEAVGPADTSVAATPGEVLTWNGSSWIPGPGGGGGVTGSPNAIVYVNPAGTGASTDPLFTAFPLDPYSRPQIRDLRTAAGGGAVWRQGAWQIDGDPQNVIGEGIVIYGAAGGLQDGSNGSFARIKCNRFAIRYVIGGVDIGYAWRVDPTHMYWNDDTGAMTAEIVRATGVATFKGWGLGFTPTNTVMDTYATVTRQFHYPDISGTGLVEEDGSGQVFIGATAKQHGSNAGVQMNSIVANRGSYRCNQYGNNTGVPGITGFKSRGATVGSLGVVQVGDTIFRATAIGATDNGSLPLSGMIGINVTYVAAGQGWIGTEFEVRTCSAKGPTNNHARRFAVSSEGIASVSEAANKMAGIAITGLGGTVTVLNDQITPTSRITLTIQDSDAGVPGAVPTAGVYVSARVPGVSFTIQSFAPADVGVMVYYQIWEPCSA